MKRKSNNLEFIEMLEYMTSSKFDHNVFEKNLDNLTERNVSYILIQELKKVSYISTGDPYASDYKREEIKIMNNMYNSSNNFYDENVINIIIKKMQNKGYKIVHSLPDDLPESRQKLISSFLENINPKLTKGFNKTQLAKKNKKEIIVKTNINFFVISAIVFSLAALLKLHFVFKFPLILSALIGAGSWFVSYKSVTKKNKNRELNQNNVDK